MVRISAPSACCPKPGLGSLRGAKRLGLPRGAGLLAILAGMLPVLSIAADEDLYFSNLPVVASVSRLPQALSDAPGSVTVIDREMIRVSGARSVSDLLRLVPGFQVAPTSTDSPRVTYHGLSDDDFSNRVQVLVDGRSLYSQLFMGGVNWNLMPVALEDIDRIEVLRGSNSAAYGSNAFLGVVNIITLEPSQARGMMASASHGNQGVRDTTLRWGGKVGSGDFRLTYQQRDDDGITNRSNWVDGFGSRLLDLRSDFAVTDRDELHFGTGHAKSHIVNGRIGKPCDPLRDFEFSSNYLHLGWRRVLAPNEEVSLRYSHTEDWASDAHQELCSGLLFNVNYGGRAVRDELEFQHTFSPWRDTRLVWGIGNQSDSARGPLWFYDNHAVGREVRRLFGNFEWRPAMRWLFNFGGMWERDSLAGTTFSPRASVSYHLSPEHTLRLGATRSYRTPSIFDVRGDWRWSPYALQGHLPLPFPAGSLYDRQFWADSSVKSEKLYSYELGYLADLKAQRMSLDVRAFHEIIPNRILMVERSLTPPTCDQLQLVGIPGCGDADYSVNAQRAKIYGIEYQWRWQPFDDTRLLFNQAFVHIEASLTSFDSTIGEDLKRRIINHAQTSAPRRSSSFMLMQKLPLGLEFAGTYHFIGKMQWTRNTEQEVAPYRRLDVRLAYPFRLGGSRGELAYVIQSANGEHAEFKFDRIFSERQWLTLRLDL